MSGFPVTSLRSVELLVPDLVLAERFYTASWGLAVAAREPGRIWLRATGADHHVLDLRQAPQAAIRAVTFRAADAAPLDRVLRAAEAAGATLLAPPAALDEPGGGRAATLRDPSGFVFRLVAGDARRAADAPARDAADRLAHVNLNCTDVDATARFFEAGLGFRLAARPHRPVGHRAAQAGSDEARPTRHPLRLMRAMHHDVAVIGFGPCGAVAAGLLGQAGFATLAVDRAPAVYDKPRAIAMDHEILRLLDGMGVAEAVLPHTAPFPASEHFGADGQLIRRIDMVPEPYPMGFVPTMVFTQPPVEAALRAHVAALPCVTVELGTELVAITQDAERVTLRLRDAAGAERVVTAGHVIACDGASSFVRRSLGIGFEDLDFDEPWLVVDLRVSDAALGKLPANAAQFCDPARPITYIVGPGNHRRFEIMLDPAEDPAAMQAPDAVLRLLSRWLQPGDAEIWRASSYRFHALVADAWRRGRVFLAGDAAHQQPPFIGQGMCQGLRDVANLVWKLAALRDGAAPALLDSYAAERGRHVRTLTARIKAIGRQICERDPAAARARDAALIAQGGGRAPVVTRQEIVPPLEAGFLATPPHPAQGTLFPQPWVRDGAGWARMDRVTGGGWRVVIAAGFPATPGAWRIGAGGLAERDGVAAAWFARHGAGAAIIRPDHYVFGVASDPASLAMLRGQLAAVLRPDVHPAKEPA